MYISAIKALRELDPSMVILQVACQPIRKYLRSDVPLRCCCSLTTLELLLLMMCCVASGPVRTRCGRSWPV